MAHSLAAPKPWRRRVPGSSKSAFIIDIYLVVKLLYETSNVVLTSTNSLDGGHQNGYIQ